MLPLLRIWGGQFIALVGAGISTFALNLWVLRETGSITQFALAFFFASLPLLLLAPVAGVWVDRYDRRWIMALCDGLALTITLYVLGLSLSDQLAVSWVYLAMFLQSCVVSLRWPAYQALITSMAPREQLPRMGGLVQLAESGNYILSPILGVILFTTYGLPVILFLDIICSLIAFTLLLSVRSVPVSVASATKSLRSDITLAYRYLCERPGLLRLLWFFAGMNLAMGVVMVLATPFVLTMVSPRELGQVLSISATGMLIGSLLMISMKSHGSPVRYITSYSLLAGIAIGVSGLYANAWWFASAGFLFFFSVAVNNAASQALWQSQVDVSLQGRVFSMRRAIGRLTMPLGQLVSGPLADAAEAKMSLGGGLPYIPQTWVGGGPGSGIALIFLGIGFYIIILTHLNLRHESFRALDRATVTAAAVS